MGLLLTIVSPPIQRPPPSRSKLIEVGWRSFSLNIRDSGFTDRIEVRRLAVSDTTGTVRFIMPTPMCPPRPPVELTARGDGSSQSEIEVPCVRSASALDGLTPNLMKIDVEGAEDIVLRGTAICWTGPVGLILEVVPQSPIDALDTI